MGRGHEKGSRLWKTQEKDKSKKRTARRWSELTEDKKRCIEIRGKEMEGRRRRNVTKKKKNCKNKTDEKNEQIWKRVRKC